MTTRPQLLAAGGCMLLFGMGCGSKLNGTYADATGVSTYRFDSSGKVYIGAMGMEVEADYKVDGDKVKLIMPQGTVVLGFDKDGTLRGPMGPMKKKSE